MHAISHSPLTKSETILYNMVRVSWVQSLSCVQLFATPWTTACQASLSITNCQSLPKPMSTESVMPSNHLILCCSLHRAFIEPFYREIYGFVLLWKITDGQRGLACCSPWGRKELDTTEQLNWKVESLCCTSESNIFFVNYTSIKK